MLVFIDTLWYFDKDAATLVVTKVRPSPFAGARSTLLFNGGAF